MAKRNGQCKRRTEKVFSMRWLISSFILIGCTQTIVTYDEEEKDFVTLNKNGSFTICIDPLDGSSNIETNAPIGSIFGIYKSRINPNETILQSGDNLIASGFFIYGPRLKLIFSIGNGTSVFQLNQNDEFVLIKEEIKIPQKTNELSN